MVGGGLFSEPCLEGETALGCLDRPTEGGFFGLEAEETAILWSEKAEVNFGIAMFRDVIGSTLKPSGTLGIKHCLFAGR